MKVKVEYNGFEEEYVFDLEKGFEFGAIEEAIRRFCSSHFIPLSEVNLRLWDKETNGYRYQIWEYKSNGYIRAMINPL